MRESDCESLPQLIIGEVEFIQEVFMKKVDLKSLKSSWNL